MNYERIILYLILSVLISLPIILIKYYTKQNNFNIILLTILLYLLIIYAYYKILIDPTTNISIVGPMTGIISVIVKVIVGVFFFKEVIHLNGYIGLLLSMISIYLLSSN